LTKHCQVYIIKLIINMKYKKQIFKIMNENNFELIRQNKHMVWQHRACGKIVVTACTPSLPDLAVKKVKCDIRRVLISQ